MPKKHTKAPSGHEIHEVIGDVIAKYYPILHGLSPTLNIGVLFVTVDDPNKQVPLKHHGMPADALIKKVSQRDRAAGGPDVLLQVDGHRWMDMTDAEKEGLIDHELAHIEVDAKKSSEGAWFAATDALERPKVTLLPHDFEIGGFYEIIRRHGNAAGELQSLNVVNERLRQQDLPFGDAGVEPAHTVTFSNPATGRSVTLTGAQLHAVADGMSARTG